MPSHRIPGPICASRLGPDHISDGTQCLARAAVPGPLGIDPAPAIASAEDSGAVWVSRFPTGTTVAECEPPFRESLQSFVSALQTAGAQVSIAATRRPPQRAYLMHWCWKVANKLVEPTAVPLHSEVNINWAHRLGGVYSASASMTAAKAMVAAYGMSNLKVAPALRSLHIAGHAVDMSISWSSTLAINEANGTTVSVATTPRDGMNPMLHAVGKTYGVIKYHGGAADRPHWSINGR